MTHEEYMKRGQVAREGIVTMDRVDPRMLTGEPWYFFNIYSNEHTAPLGNLGHFVIPACPPDQPYVRSGNVIPGMVEEMYAHFTDTEEYRSRLLVGADVAACVLGYGQGNSPGEDMRRFGMFASPNPKPTSQELAAAKQRLVVELTNQIREADELAAAADPELQQSARNPKYYRAARYMGVKKSWLTEVAAMTMCPYCGTDMRPGVPVCSSCHRIVDQARYDALEASRGVKKAN